MFFPRFSPIVDSENRVWVSLSFLWLHNIANGIAARLLPDFIPGPGQNERFLSLHAFCFSFCVLLHVLILRFPILYFTDTPPP